MNFIIGLSLSTDWKKHDNDAVFVKVDQLTKIIHNDTVKTTINKASLAKTIIDMVAMHYSLSQINCQWSKFTIYLKVLVFTILLFRYKAKTFHYISFIDERLSQVVE